MIHFINKRITYAIKEQHECTVPGDYLTTFIQHNPNVRVSLAWLYTVTATSKHLIMLFFHNIGEQMHAVLFILSNAQ